jgi:hypothetical protein
VPEGLVLKGTVLVISTSYDKTSSSETSQSMAPRLEPEGLTTPLRKSLNWRKSEAVLIKAAFTP